MERDAVFGAAHILSRVRAVGRGGDGGDGGDVMRLLEGLRGDFLSEGLRDQRLAIRSGIFRGVRRMRASGLAFWGR